MEVDDGPDHQLHLCPRDFVKQMSLVMDDHGSQPHPRRSGMRVSTKSKAPSPPGLNKLNSPGFSQWYPGSPELKMDQKENLIDEELSLVVVLPGGVEKMTTVHGSKPLMDLLVTLCAKYHLNPSSHTLELVTTNRSNVKLKPNALIGTSDAQKIIIKPKGEDKNKKTGPHMPEATVRMVINYKQTQKTILRVNPRVPLAELLPAICEKCEFETESTVLLRDVQSLAPLDLSSSLNDYAIREVYARDTKRQPASPVFPASPTHSGSVTPGKDKTQKEKENKGLFSMFRKSKKKPEQAMTASAPASPVLVSKPRPLSMALPSSHSSPLGSSTIPTDVPKKRRAPPPPILVSQGCPSDLSPRQRLSSEPNAQLDSDQVAGLSRGSSAESSLKRTKRKAPPPPTSPSVVVPETFPQDEHSPGSTPANTLEEIMEQEEANGSVKSATASDTQGEDISLSPDVSLHSPSPDTEIVSTMSIEGNGEDQSCDLSSDGNHLQSTVNDSANVVDVETSVGTDSPETTDANSGSCPVETVDRQGMCEESPVESVEVNSSTVPAAPPPPLSQRVMQEAEAQTSIQVNTETLGVQTDTLDRPATTGTSHTTGEDAQVQTDFPSLPASSQEHADNVPPSSNATVNESGLKKDMATETEDLGPSDIRCALSHTSETTSIEDATPCAPPPTKTPSLYATDAEPKPKPSNELTRDYIPKVGMTTYTIVPQKSLEKLRYFEVALTLETPPAAPQEGLDIGSLQLEEKASSMGQTDVSKETSELHSLSCSQPREDLVMSNSTTTVHGSIPQSVHSSTSLSQADKEISSTATQASQAGSPAEVKEIKIPPATKPKPGSFRLPQHKKTPGYYVTSAAEKSLSASPSYSQKEAQGNAERAKLPPPPLPPPVQCPEETAGDANVRLSPKVDDKDGASTRLTRQCSLPSREATLGLSLEKLRSFAAPRPFSPTTPSRFAQAVSSAVRRSQSLSHAPQSPKSPPYSPDARSPVVASKGLSEFKDSEATEVHHDKDSTIQEEESEPPSFSGSVQVEGESTV